MTTENQDQQLNCIDCNQPFTFTKGEQTFFAEKGFTPPRRCKACRDVRKQEKQRTQGGNGASDNSASGNDAGGNPSFWADDNRGQEDRGGRRKRR